MFRSLSLTPVLAFALLLGACDTEAPPAPQETKAAKAESTAPFFDRSQAGDAMPAVTLTDPQGKTLETATLKGKPVLLNLWATWCAPCVKEMPLLDDVAANYAGKLAVVTVSEDMGKAEAVSAFFAARDLPNLTQWIDPDMTLMGALGANTLPVTILYDAQGKEVWRVLGDMDWSAAEQRAAIDAALVS